MKAETKLRQWLKKEWGEVQWVEAAQGGTPGIPDAVLDLPSGPVEVELKVWRPNQKGMLVCNVRPAQIRYHTQAAEKGKRTAFLAGVIPPCPCAAFPNFTATPSNMTKFMFPGWRVPTNIYQVPKMQVVCSKEDIVSLLEDELFWEKEDE